MQNLVALLIGIVSGIITTALIYLAVLIFRKIVIPWYQELVYKGLDVSGEWHVYFTDVQAEVINISQRAHRLTGKSTLVAKDVVQQHTDRLKVYDLHGSISNRFVTITLQQTNKSRLGVASLLLEVKGDGQKMEGYYSYYSVALSKVQSEPCVVYRNVSLMHPKTSSDKTDQTKIVSLPSQSVPAKQESSEPNNPTPK